MSMTAFLQGARASRPPFSASGRKPPLVRKHPAGRRLRRPASGPVGPAARRGRSRSPMENSWPQPENPPVSSSKVYLRISSTPDISHFRIGSADFQSAFSAIATAKPTASRRSGLLAFRAGHEISGLRPRLRLKLSLIKVN